MAKLTYKGPLSDGSVLDNDTGRSYEFTKGVEVTLPDALAAALVIQTPDYWTVGAASPAPAKSKLSNPTED